MRGAPAAAALVLMVSGCTPAGDPLCGRQSAPAPELLGVMALVGQRVEVVLELPLRLSCPGGTPVATQVEGRVTDEGGVLVSAEVTPPHTDPNSGWSTSVSFTPPEAGIYHLLARFEPSLGVQQREVVAAGLTRDAGLRLTPRLACQQLALLDSGAVACATAMGVDVYRNGVLDETIEGSAVLLGQGALWTWSTTSASRWRDERPLRRDLQVAVQFASLPVGAAAGDELMLAGPGRLERVGEFPLASAFRPSPPRVTHLVRDDLEWVVAGDQLVCRLKSLDPEVLADCSSLPATVRASERNGLWVEYSTGAWAWLQGQREIPAPRRSQELQPRHQPGSSPYFTWGQYLLARQLPRLTLEAFPTAGGAEAMVTERVVWWKARTGVVEVFRRAATPSGQP